MSGSRGMGSDEPSEQCQVLEPSLAAFAEGVLPPGEARTVAAHVASCGWCAARMAAHAEVEALIREAPTPMPPASLRAGLYARIAAAGRQASQQHHRPAWELIVRETDPADVPAVSAPPTHPSRQRPAPAARTRWVGLVAAVLVVALLAGIFATRGRGGASTGSVAQPTATAVPQRACAPSEVQASLPARSRLADLAMTGPGMGWAVGAIADSDAASTSYHTLILRFRDCRWEPIGASLPNAGLASIAMVSPNEGWAAGGTYGHTPLLLHYADGVWSTVTPPPTGNIFGFVVVRALPNGEVWVVGRTPAGKRVSSGIALLHRSNGQWTRLETSLNAVSDIAPTGPGDAWVIGFQYPTFSTLVAELAHIQGGSLGAEVLVDTRIQLATLRMLTPTDGWAMGSMYVSGNETDTNPTITRPIALHYDGSRWTEAHTGVSASARVIDVLGQGSAWSYTTRGIPEYIISTHREHAGTWQDVAWPFKDIDSFARLTCVAEDDCWAIGSYSLVDTTQPHGNGGTITIKYFGSLLLRYANGAWHEYGHI